VMRLIAACSRRSGSLGFSGRGQGAPVPLAAGQSFAWKNPPSRVSPLAWRSNSLLPVCRVNFTPHSISSRIRAGRPARRGRPCRRGKARPRLWVSSMWDSKVSSSLQTVGDPALRVVGARLGRLLLGDDGDRALLRRPERETQTGDSAADDQEFRYLSMTFPPSVGPRCLTSARSCT